MVLSYFVFFHSHQQQLIIANREPNVSATMQQPSSVVHSKLQYTQALNTQRKYGKRQVFISTLLVGLATCTSSVKVGACNQLVICWGEFSSFPIQRVGGLTPDVPCRFTLSSLCSNWIKVWSWASV